ncbi:MAG: T9SS type A sorting domain-containing protein [Calditrichaeota bacterium]|nr:T9SS type A sorting domain-containing protein [Calditrichota bacterium]MCB9365662.1 T9SS type A sorting domain-containing protein [Calditrichota bacterium]MCB9391949.1 T9SS type A sorting domain-containing protein [Calditrichota bacterium]
MKRLVIVLSLCLLAAAAVARTAQDVRMNMESIRAELGAVTDVSRAAELKQTYQNLSEELAALTGEERKTHLDDCPGTVANSYCTSAEAITLANGTAFVSGNTAGGGEYGVAFECGVAVESCVLWYTLTGTGTELFLHTCEAPTDFDTKIHVLRGNCGELTCVAANDDWFTSEEGLEDCAVHTFASDVVFCSEPGVTYYVLISGWNGHVGSFGLTVIDLETQCTPPCVQQDYYFTVDQIPSCHCLSICENQIQKIFVGPAGPYDRPVVSWSDGCLEAADNLPPSGCEEECEPAFPVLYMDWIYLPDRQLWCMDIYSQSGGCYCFCLDDILPVELNSFAAVAGDAQVTVNWTTASESDLDRFEVTRDGLIAAQLSAQNSATGANYSWTDRDLVNGTAYRYELIAVNTDGTREVLASESVSPSATSGVVTEYALHQNYPNPFNPTTTIAFDLLEAGAVKISVYNMLGQEVATLVNGTLNTGRHSVSFDAAGLSSGLYIYKMEANGFSTQQKMLFLK